MGWCKQGRQGVEVVFSHRGREGINLNTQEPMDQEGDTADTCFFLLCLLSSYLTLPNLLLPNLSLVPTSLLPTMCLSQSPPCVFPSCSCFAGLVSTKINCCFIGLLAGGRRGLEIFVMCKEGRQKDRASQSDRGGRGMGFWSVCVGASAVSKQV